MINQLWQRKLVSPVICSAPLPAHSPAKPCSVPLWSEMGQGMEVVDEPYHCPLFTQAGASLVSGGGEVAVTILAYQTSMTQVQEMMCLDGKIQFPFAYLLQSEVP